jgi:hypothetical protein
MNRSFFTILVATAAISLVATVTLARAQSDSFSALNLAGRWTLDPYLSDNPGQVAAAIRMGLGSALGEELFPGGQEAGRPGTVGTRGPERGRPGRPGDGKPQDKPLNTEEKNQLNELAQVLQYPPLALSISQSSSTLALTDPHGQTRTLQLTGKSEKQPLGSNVVDCTTKVEGPQIISEYQVGKGRTLVYRYSRVPTTGQLLITISFERVEGQPGPVQIRQVYDTVAQQQTHESEDLRN